MILHFHSKLSSKQSARYPFLQPGKQQEESEVTFSQPNMLISIQLSLSAGYNTSILLQVDLHLLSLWITLTLHCWINQNHLCTWTSLFVLRSLYDNISLSIRKLMTLIICWFTCATVLCADCSVAIYHTATWWMKHCYVSHNCVGKKR